ncbi:MAG: HlyD family efflux transporter periplasmic adaptor subunit [Lentisphaeria bacterium]|nr:HlyD family efflux transporter periplasmic adaptor subunit [Lentisphaeria bacterium]
MMRHAEKFNFRRLLRTFRRIGIAVLIMLGVLLLLVMFGSMDDEVSGPGIVTGIREYELKSLVDAQCVKIFHKEGDEVSAGEPLMELDSRHLQDEITLLKHQLQELQRRVSAKEKELTLVKRDPLPDYYRNTEIELAEARERLKLAEKEFDTYADLYTKKAVTRKEFLQVELNLLNCRMNVRRLQRDLQLVKGGMAQQIIARVNDELAQLRHQLSAKQDEVAMSVKALADYIIRAPDSGVLTVIPPRPGNYYTKGDVTAKISVNKYKKVIGMIPENQIYKVQRGQRVRIKSNQYNYLDYGYFYGQVDTIYQLPEDIDGIKHYPVKIVFAENMPLRFGSGCEVSIITGREKILALLLGIRSKDYWVRRGLKEPVRQ